MEVRELIDVFIKYGVSILAIGISFFSLRESKKVNKMQLRLSKMEEQLKKYELEEIEKIREAANKSVVEARIYKLSKGKYRLKFWNSGQATAYDVDYEVLDDAGDFIFRDKVPFEELESGKSFEESIIHHMGMPSKIKIKTKWNDATGEQKEKEQWVTF